MISRRFRLKELEKGDLPSLACDGNCRHVEQRRFPFTPLFGLVLCGCAIGTWILTWSIVRLELPPL